MIDKHAAQSLTACLLCWLDRHTDVEAWDASTIAETYHAFTSIIETWAKEQVRAGRIGEPTHANGARFRQANDDLA